MVFYEFRVGYKKNRAGALVGEHSRDQGNDLFPQISGHRPKIRKSNNDLSDEDPESRLYPSFIYIHMIGYVHIYRHKDIKWQYVNFDTQIWLWRLGFDFGVLSKIGNCKGTNIAERGVHSLGRKWQPLDTKQVKIIYVFYQCLNDWIWGHSLWFNICQDRSGNVI